MLQMQSFSFVLPISYGCETGELVHDRVEQSLNSKASDFTVNIFVACAQDHTTTHEHAYAGNRRFASVRLALPRPNLDVNILYLNSTFVDDFAGKIRG